MTHSRRDRQHGIATVEFAIVLPLLVLLLLGVTELGAAMLLLLFGVIEIGRAMFVLNALGESTRRAARVATVCPINDPAILEVGLFNTPGGGTGTQVVGGLTAGNFAVEYLDANGNVI